MLISLFEPVFDVTEVLVCCSYLTCICLYMYTCIYKQSDALARIGYLYEAKEWIILHIQLPEGTHMPTYVSPSSQFLSLTIISTCSRNLHLCHNAHPP